MKAAQALQLAEAMIKQISLPSVYAYSSGDMAQSGYFCSQHCHLSFGFAGILGATDVLRQSFGVRRTCVIDD